MNVRRLATTAATMLVAIVCAITVPTTQLRTASTLTTCCCPDPSHCHCPDHKGDGGQRTPSMRACHRQSQEFVSPVLPAFTPPAVVAIARPDCATTLVATPLRSPHVAPAARRPDAPS